MKLDGSGLLVLVDPVRTSAADAERIGREAKAAGVRGLLIGSSFDGAVSRRVDKYLHNFKRLIEAT